MPKRALAEQILTRLRESPQDIGSLRLLRRQISKEIAELDREDVLRAAGVLKRCSRFFAYELVLHHRATVASLTREEAEDLGAGIASWSDVDTFACYVTGPGWRDGKITDSAIRAWAKSGDRWWRRTALVSTVPLNVAAQGGRGDSKRTLDICGRLVGDRDDMVVKALSWALRALVKSDAGGVEEFLRTYREELAPRVLREVNHKIGTGLKNPRNFSRSSRM